MAEGSVGGGGVPIAPIISGGLQLAFHKDKPLSPELIEQIEQGNQYIIDLAQAWEEFTGIPLGFQGTSIQELGQHLQAVSGMSMQELGEFLGVPPPPLFAGAPVLETMELDLGAELNEFLDIATSQSLSLDSLLEQLSQLLLNPKRAPGEPCLAPAPLLRDLLDLALGRIGGGIGAVIAKVGGSVKDLLLPGFSTADDLSHFIQAILDDPITAALNLVLGQRNQIDCIVEGSLGVGEGVLEAGVRKLKEAIAEAIA